MATPKLPRHARIMAILRNRIARGAYEGKLPGGRALAAEFGTDPTTIRVALARLEALGLVRRSQKRGTFAVPPSSRSRQAPDMYARLVLPDPLVMHGQATSWGLVIVYGLQKRARELGMNMVIEYAESIDAEVEKCVVESKAVGCIGTCLLSMAPEVRYLMKLADASSPVVLLEDDIEDPVIPCVIFDHLDAGKQAAEHLVKLGHRRIAFVIGEPSSLNTRNRRKGVVEYLRAVGLGLAADLACHGEDYPILEGLFRAPRPTAVVVSSRYLAEAVVTFAASRGLRVPGDLSIVTFGESRTYRLFPVTLVASDHEALGRRAVDALLDEDLWANPRRVRLPVKLADFGTTAPPANP